MRLCLHVYVAAGFNRDDACENDQPGLHEVDPFITTHMLVYHVSRNERHHIQLPRNEAPVPGCPAEEREDQIKRDNKVVGLLACLACLLASDPRQDLNKQEQRVHEEHNRRNELDQGQVLEGEDEEDRGEEGWHAEQEARLQRVVPSRFLPVDGEEEDEGDDGESEDDGHQVDHVRSCLLSDVAHELMLHRRRGELESVTRDGLDLAVQALLLLFRQRRAALVA